MLTRSGRGVLVGGVAALLVGRVFGLLELMVLGAVAVALVGAARLSSALRPPVLHIDRRVRPLRVHAGSASRVELTVGNPGRRRSPLSTIVDGVSGTVGARLKVAPVAPGEQVVATYRLPTEHRGIVTVGPLEVVVSDPFGLSRRAAAAGPLIELTVLPRVDPLLPLPLSLGNDPLAGAEHPHDLGRSGDDFYALRPYVVGDDLRRVHWPSTARVGELLVRQDEQPWQGRVTVVLDVDGTAADHDTFERMVSAAASIVTASRRRGDLVRLVTTAGLDSGFLSGHTQLDWVMEELAVVQRSGSASLTAALGPLGHASGAVVAVVGAVGAPDLAAVGHSRAASGGATVVRFTSGGAARGSATPGPKSAAAAGASLGRVRLIDVAPGQDLAAAWDPAVRRR